MSQNDIVSVIVPIYNAEKYLKECIDSIINQTYSNIQIILVNDGSKDSSWKICKKFEKEDKRIIAFTQSNSGVSVARNVGLQNAIGKWIMFVDPDDVLDLTILENLLSKADADTDIVACTCYGFIDKIKKRASFFKNDRIFSDDKTDLFLQLSDDKYGQTGELVTAIGVPWGKIYRHSFIKKYNLEFDPKLRRMQDNVFNLYAFYYAIKIYYLNAPLYFYRLDHINNYVLKHYQHYEKLFLPVIEEKYKFLEKYHLSTNRIIYNAYLNEASNIFFKIINSAINSKNTFTYIKNKINWLMEQPCFIPLFEKRNIHNIDNKKIKIKVFLIKHKLYRLYIFTIKGLQYRNK